MAAKLSRLGFGLSTIAGSGSFKHQQNLVRTAIDSGITHFDVAPYYGSGDAEKILGDILSTCNDEVTITTKYGLTPLSIGKGGSAVRALLRPVFRKVNGLKRLATSMVVKVNQPKQQVYLKGNLTTSIENSIKNLRRPIDIFLLHDAGINLAETPELMDELEEVRNDKKTLFTGISGENSVLEKVVSKYADIYQVAQLENSLAYPAPVQRLAQFGTKVITHRAIQGGLKQLIFLLENRPGFKRIWQNEIGEDPGNHEKLALILIQLAMQENPHGTILFSTTKSDRIKQIGSIIKNPPVDYERCIKLRQLFADINYIT